MLPILLKMMLMESAMGGEQRAGGDRYKAGQQRVLHHVLPSLVADKPQEGTVHFAHSRLLLVSGNVALPLTYNIISPCGQQPLISNGSLVPFFVGGLALWGPKIFT